MTGENSEDLTPAQVAELMGVPSSTLRTYATEFGGLLSQGAQGDPSVAGRAFGHRRYTRDDLQVLSRAKTLVDEGLSYRGALARLSGDASGSFVRRLPRTRAARSRESPKVEQSRAQAPAPPPPVIELQPLPAPAPTPERRVQVVADPAAAEAIQNLAGVVHRLVNVIEEMNARIGRLEAQLAALPADHDRQIPVPVARKSWLTRVFGSRD